MALINWANLLGFLATIGSGYIRYNGKSIGEVSSLYPTIITPAGFAFAIWGLIYLSVGSYTVWQLLPNAASTPYVKAVNTWYLLASVFQTLWVPAFCYEQLLLADVLIWGIWVSLLAANVELVRLNFKMQKEGSSSFGTFQLVAFPFALWFGWLTAASLINTTIVLQYVVHDAFYSSAVWGGVVITLAASFGAVWGGVTLSWPSCLALAWAAFGIFSNPSDSAVKIVSASASGGLAFFAVVLAILAYARHRLVLRLAALSFAANGTTLPVDEEQHTSLEMQDIPMEKQPYRAQFFFAGQPVVFAQQPQQQY